VIFARRLIAQRCLYGVDRNPVAVDLAKMSLWLATLAKDHPLTFVDHALQHGDSLVGLYEACRAGRSRHSIGIARWRDLRC
jgi:type II restriction/modification system DNA methylase subunit YeeA